MKKKHLFLFFKFILTFLLFYLVSTKVDVDFVVRNLLSANLTYIFCIEFLILFQIALSAIRWFLVTETIEAQLPIKNIFSYTFISQFFNQSLPTSLGGDAYKIWQLTNDGLLLNKSMSSVLCDRFIGLISLCVLIFIGVFFIPISWGMNLIPIKESIFFLVMALTLLIIFNKKIFLFFQRNNQIIFLTTLIEDIYTLFFLHKKILKIILLSVLIHLISVYVFYLIAEGIDFTFSFFEAFILVPIVMLMAMIPISYAGWGMREASIVFVFSFAGIDNSFALTASILYGICLLFSGIPGLLILLTKNNFLLQKK